jgi:predicted N-acyltransferase
MRKTFKLQIEGKNPDRVLEAIKHEIRKYVKRERRRDLPEGVDFWDFDCKFGLTQEAAQEVHFATLTSLIDAVAKDKGEQFYIEILAKHGHRQARPERAVGASATAASVASAANFLEDDAS